MATRKQILNRKRNWSIFLAKGILHSLSEIQDFFELYADAASYGECEKCREATGRMLEILKEHKI